MVRGVEPIHHPILRRLSLETMRFKLPLRISSIILFLFALGHHDRISDLSASLSTR